MNYVSNLLVCNTVLYQVSCIQHGPVCCALRLSAFEVGSSSCLASDVTAQGILLLFLEKGNPSGILSKIYVLGGRTLAWRGKKREEEREKQFLSSTWLMLISFSTNSHHEFMSIVPKCVTVFFLGFFCALEFHPISITHALQLPCSFPVLICWPCPISAIDFSTSLVLKLLKNI